MSRLTFHPLTPSRWSDLEQLFGKNGASGGCWCMWWRTTRAEYEKRKGLKNKAAFKRIVKTGIPPGILAYDNRQPVGWCAIGPRTDYPRLDTSKTLARVDDKAVWSVSCFFVTRTHRHTGLSVHLLKAAVAFARAQGATLIEGYPVEPKTKTMPEAFAWTGIASTFRKAGFREVLRRSDTRPIMRRCVCVTSDHRPKRHDP